MLKLSTVRRLSNEVRALARKVLRGLPAGSPAREIAESALISPLDYMRYAEFDAVLRDLELRPGMRVLDVSSPQWFTVCLAVRHPGVSFYYGNILASEREPYQQIAATLGLTNLQYGQEDVRKLTFADGTFDKVVSISVIEHVYPEETGDLAALAEIRRVLKPGGECFLTLPYKATRNVVYMNGPVFERTGGQRTFFAREYDANQFNDLVKASGFSLQSCWFISERLGLLAADYYEWGPGRGSRFIPYYIRLKRLLERVFRRPVEDVLAWWYLDVTHTPLHRLVNAAAVLRASG